MTLDEAIKHEEELADGHDRIKQIKAVTLEECRRAEEHRQLAEWLKDYKRLKEQEPIDCANAEHDADGCLGYSTDRGGYSYCQTCLECPKASINNWDKEQEPCDDAISKSATLDAIIKRLGIKNETYLLEAERVIYQQILAMPPISPKPKMGQWEWVQYDSNPNIGNWNCSECRCIGRSYFNYCPNCGAKMQEVEQ